MLADIALRRLHLIATSASGTDPQRKLIYLAQLAGMGYRVENPQDYRDSVLSDFAQRMETLRAMRAGQVDYVPLFSGFPDRVPEDRSYFVNRLIGFLVNECLDDPAGQRLQSGVVVPQWLFELEQFGADPITQMQDPQLLAAARENRAELRSDRHVEWVSLRFAPLEQVRQSALEFLRANLYAKSSIQEVLRPDLEWLLQHFSPALIDPARVIFRETRTYLTRFYWLKGDYESVGRLADTPTDYLRLFAALTGGDISLAEKTRYPKLTRPQRRLVLQSLERSPNLEEDLRRYRGLWLAV